MFILDSRVTINGRKGEIKMPNHNLCMDIFNLPYARHYNPRFVYFLPAFWSSKTFWRVFFLKIMALCMFSVQERVIVARVQ